MKDVTVVTTNDLPGYEIVEVYGEVFGLIVRSRNIFSNIVSGSQYTEHTSQIIC